MALVERFTNEELEIEVHEGESFRGIFINQNNYLFYTIKDNRWASAQIPKTEYKNPEAVKTVISVLRRRLNNS